MVTMEEVAEVMTMAAVVTTVSGGEATVAGHGDGWRWW